MLFLPPVCFLFFIMVLFSFHYFFFILWRHIFLQREAVLFIKYPSSFCKWHRFSLSRKKKMTKNQICFMFTWTFIITDVYHSHINSMFNLPTCLFMGYLSYPSIVYIQKMFLLSCLHLVVTGQREFLSVLRWNGAFVWCNVVIAGKPLVPDLLPYSIIVELLFGMTSTWVGKRAETTWQSGYGDISEATPLQTVSQWSVLPRSHSVVVFYI